MKDSTQSPPGHSLERDVEEVAHGAAKIAQTELNAGAMTTSGVIMQSITHMGPAIGLATSLAFVTSFVGVTSPIVYGLALLIVLSICSGLTRLAKNFPSAGGYFTYTSRTLHPRIGLLTAWLYFLYDPLVAAIMSTFFGYILQEFLMAQYGFDFPWWITFLVFTSLVTFALYRGVKFSVRTLMVVGAIEIGVLVALAISGLISPGDGGTNLEPFNPANAPLNGLYLAVVFSIVTFTGFESVAPLAEESEDPTRTIPRAIIISVLLLGAFVLFTSWGIVVGWGTEDSAALAETAENPVLVVAQDLWGFGWVLAMFAIANSALGTALAASNASTRVFFAMARVGVLPRWLAKVSPTSRTPVNAITFQSIVTLIVGLGVGFWIGPDYTFFVIGLMLTLGLIFVYGAGNIGAMRYYLTEARSRLNVFLDVILPIVSTAALIWVGYKSIVPLPESPLRYAPFIVAGWLALGVLVVLFLALRGREDWAVRASEAAYEGSGDGAPADLARRE